MVEELRKLNIAPLLDKEIDLDRDGLCEIFDECCFDIKLCAEKISENMSVIQLEIAPQEASTYELIIDYVLVINSKTIYREKDFWSKKEILESIIIHEPKVRIIFGVAVHQALSPEDVTQKTSLRYYRLLCAGTTFYINPTHLKKLDCALFNKFYDDEVTHEDCTIIQELTGDDLEMLLKTCCGYSSVVIHSRNIFEIGEIALQFRIVGVIRAIDAFIRSLKLMHPVRKLEIAYSFRLTQVADGIIREYTNSMERLSMLHDYLRINDELESDMHPDVLKMLDIYDDYIIL